MKNEYKDLIERFEKWMTPEDLENIKDPFLLQNALEDFFPEFQPTPKQAKVFTEHYETTPISIPEDKYLYEFEHKEGFYTRKTGIYAHYKKERNYEHTEEVVYNYKYGRRLVIRDKIHGGVLKHLKNLDTGEYLIGKKYY